MGLRSGLWHVLLPRLYEFRSRFFRRGWPVRLFVGLVGLTVGIPVLSKALTTYVSFLGSSLRGPLTVALVALWVIAGLVRVWKEFDPAHIQVVQEHYLARKLAFFPLIARAQEWQRYARPDQVRDFQMDTLWLIAAYTRDHRTDFRGTQIFASLLVPDGPDLVVVARDTDARPVPRRYSADENLLCWRAFSEDAWKATGDVYRDFPSTAPDKPYSSILAIPVRDDQNRVLGVVSIDSSRKFHFDLVVEDLMFYLMPYVTLLAWTIPLSRKFLQTDPVPNP